jgi:predicted nucleic acid-binding protein
LGPLVYSECGTDCGIKIQEAVTNNNLTLLDDSGVKSSMFLELIERFRLGEGETECLALSMGTDFQICSDDRKARRICEIQIGEKRVTGSLGILREAVHLGLLTAEDAIQSYYKMKLGGGFLPNIDVTFFK